MAQRREASHRYISHDVTEVLTKSSLPPFMAALADELERRNAEEEALRAAGAEAVAAAEREAARRVEEGFREASFAVSKAMWVGALKGRPG